MNNLFLYNTQESNKKKRTLAIAYAKEALYGDKKGVNAEL